MTKDKKEKEDEIEYETRLDIEEIEQEALEIGKERYLQTETASKASTVKRGVKEVVKGLRKGVKGLVILAGDISPIDVITHIPVLCEDNDVQYCYVPSKEDLGSAGSTKRPTSVVMIVYKKDADYAEAYDEVMKEVKEMSERMTLNV